MAEEIIRDEQVVASKLPREEFANFKKLCDLEEKTPSKKIRELINNEVNEKFNGLYKSIYDKKKVKEFNLDTLEDYNDSLIVEKICKVNFVDRPDGNFVQVGLRPVLEEDIFLPVGNVDPRLPSLGRFVALGEMDFLISSILKENKIERKKINKKNIETFPIELDLEESSIIISTNFYVTIAQLFAKRIQYKDQKMILDQRHELFFDPDETIKDKIIIIKKDAIFWTKQKFHNPFSEKEEALDISITPMIGGKVDIVARSMNKIKALYPDGIKILEIEE